MLASGAIGNCGREVYVEPAGCARLAGSHELGERFTLVLGGVAGEATIGLFGSYGNTQRVRITPAGMTAVQPIWERFRKLSAKLFDMQPLKGLSQAEIEAHIKVNEAISRALREWRDPAKGLL